MKVLGENAAVAAAKREIAARLRSVCDNLTQDEFDQLVSRMAQIDLKYRTRDFFGVLFGSPRAAPDSRPQPDKT
jgi:hypothetical protein